jgi:hypothetical protein
VHRSSAWRNMVGAAKMAGRSSSFRRSASTVSRSPALNRSSLYLKSSPTNSMDTRECGSISSCRKLFLMSTFQCTETCVADHEKLSRFTFWQSFSKKFESTMPYTSSLLEEHHPYRYYQRFQAAFHYPSLLIQSQVKRYAQKLPAPRAWLLAHQDSRLLG